MGNCAINPFPCVDGYMHHPGLQTVATLLSSWGPFDWGYWRDKNIIPASSFPQLEQKDPVGSKRLPKTFAKPSGVTCDGLFPLSNVSKAPKALVPSKWITPDMSEAASKSVASALALMLPVCNKRSISIEAAINVPIGPARHRWWNTWNQLRYGSSPMDYAQLCSTYISYISIYGFVWK